MFLLGPFPFVAAVRFGRFILEEVDVNINKEQNAGSVDVDIKTLK